MAVERTQPVQEVFLRHLQDHKVPVTMFLKSGIKLQGYVTSVRQLLRSARAGWAVATRL
jgi:sRNA-binding regulator protein Hfq